MKLSATEISECALFVALMTVGAYVKIPFQPVPLTFQTVISITAGLLLGAKKGGISMAIYCFAGLLGLPVFTEGSGIYYVLKPTFGYILGFTASAVVAGLIAGGNKKANYTRLLFASVCAFLVNYAVGIPYCMTAVKLLGLTDLKHVFVYGNLLYMPKDCIFCLASALIARQVRPLILKGKRTEKLLNEPNNCK